MRGHWGFKCKEANKRNKRKPKESCISTIIVPLDKGIFQWPSKDNKDNKDKQH